MSQNKTKNKQAIRLKSNTNISTNKIRIRLTFIEIIAFLLYFVTFMSISDMSFNGLLGNFLIASIVSSVFLLSKKYAEGLLRNIQSVMFYILIPSLVFEGVDFSGL